MCLNGKFFSSILWNIEKLIEAYRFSTFWSTYMNWVLKWIERSACSYRIIKWTLLFYLNRWSNEGKHFICFTCKTLSNRYSAENVFMWMFFFLFNVYWIPISKDTRGTNILFGCLIRFIAWPKIEKSLLIVDKNLSRNQYLTERHGRVEKW